MTTLQYYGSMKAQGRQLPTAVEGVEDDPLQMGGDFTFRWGEELCEVLMMFSVQVSRQHSEHVPPQQDTQGPAARGWYTQTFKMIYLGISYSSYSQINEGEMFKNYSTFCWMVLLWSKGELHHEYLYEIEMHFL